MSSPITSTMTTTTPLLNQWNPWTEKSAEVEYTHRPAGTGCGEWKVAAELDGRILGQNSPYDMDIVLNDVPYKVEVKEPDSNTFRSGRNGRDELRPVKAHITTLLQTCMDLCKVESVWIPERMCERLSALAEVSPDELAEKTVVKLEQMCQELHIVYLSLSVSLPSLAIFDCFTGEKKTVKADVFYSTAVSAGKTEQQLRELMGDDCYTNTKMIVDHLCHPYIQNPLRIRDELNALRRIFYGYLLVFVDKERGYYLMDAPETKVTFQRVTLGTPRFHTNI
jgi:hypothetical protein